MASHGRQGGAGHVGARHGTVRFGRYGSVCYVMARSG